MLENYLMVSCMFGHGKFFCLLMFQNILCDYEDF